MQIKKLLTGIVVVFLALGPSVVLAYGQGYYQGYYQPYYQGTYYAQGTYYSQGSYQTTISVDTIASSNVSVTGSISKGSGTFAIDHPLDPKNKLLFHSFVESPDVKNIYDGIAMLDKNGEVTIELPTYFEALNNNVRYQIKPIGAPMPNLYVKEEEHDNRFAVAGGAPGGKISWQITGIRHDPYIEANPIIPVVEKSSTTLVDKGSYLFPDGYKNRTIGGLFTGVSAAVRWLLHWF